ASPRGFVEETSGSVIEEYRAIHTDKKHVAFVEIVGLPGRLPAPFARERAVLRGLLGSGRRHQQGADCNSKNNRYELMDCLHFPLPFEPAFEFALASFSQLYR